MKKMLPLLLALAVAIASFSTVLADTAYVVQRGDTLYRIAARFGVSVQAIAAANRLTNVNVIYVGQRLTIPSPGGTPVPTNAPWTGQYVVQRGDTLYRIAQRFATTVDALKRANNLGSNLIYAGQILNIPGAATPRPVTPPPPTVPPTQAVCAINWFATPRPLGCPATAPVESWAAAQRFERGLMLWVQGSDTFYILVNSPDQSAAQARIVVGPLALRPGADINRRVGGVPAGRTEPISGFGLVWRGEVVGVNDVRALLGWALEPEAGFTIATQCEVYPGTNLPSPRCYMRGPDGTVYYTYHVQHFGNYWGVWR